MREGRSVYSAREQMNMTERQLQIANYTYEEWCKEWDRITGKIRKKYAEQIKEINRKKEELTKKMGVIE